MLTPALNASLAHTVTVRASAINYLMLGAVKATEKSDNEITGIWIDMAVLQAGVAKPGTPSGNTPRIIFVSIAQIPWLTGT